MKTFDFAVVGKGMMGAAAARHLARFGARVVLVGPDEPANRRTHGGVFASHYDSGRITRTIDADPDWALLAQRSIARYAEIEAESGISFHTEVGCVIAAPKAGEAIMRFIATRDRVGVDVAELDPAELRSAFPALRFPEEYTGLLEMRAAGIIDPRALVAAQVRLAKAAGATVITAEVAAVHDRGRHVEVSTVNGERYAAARTLVAVGGFSIRSELLPRPLDLKVKARTVLLAEVQPEDVGRYAAMPCVICSGTGDADSFYVLPPVRYPDGGLKIKIGGDPSDRLLANESVIRAWFSGDGDTAAAAHMRRHLEALLPDLRPGAFSTMPCVTTCTRHGHPYIGFAESHRIIVLTGGNGAAAKSSDEIGRLGALLAADGRICTDEYMTNFEVCFL
ncbi:NAD(P)/FAD-dependent oxidoreductase [Methylobacterium sp. SyP6R]|uniref:NAD(P)/FAD-dependent oxidoreductase n=1 Tax=Methylobacterium sp. SyP6R TaxID=2718876 RepID=UPI001F1C59CF|nr:FAD-dependent oxidoreductase [Methylobacterium sp. SyP6R]MCF4130065.1 FAD-binding oxidoreductase [Methylobacterium sp. SyP6R]